ncbi:hypothetical protein D3C78_1161110 [compost metagenome]
MELPVDVPVAVLQLAGVAAQAVFAGEDVRRVQFFQRSLPAPELRGKATVRIVFMRPQAQPLYLRMGVRQLAGQADTRRWRQAGGDCDVNADADRALAVEQPLFAAA